MLSGVLPDSFGNYTNLEEDYLLDNQLSGALLSYPVLRPKSNTHSMCAQEHLFHIYGQESVHSNAKCLE
jgi:hypothetical protein